MAISKSARIKGRRVRRREACRRESMVVGIKEGALEEMGSKGMYSIRGVK